MLIALASPRVARSLEDGLERIERLLSEAAARGASIVCFPEAYLPGLRGLDFEVFAYDPSVQERALDALARMSARHRIAAIHGIEDVSDEGRRITATVIDANGAVVGRQIKTQLDPSEDANYVPGIGRNVFEIDGLRFGIAICHEGWRYPETVRWAAVRGAHIVFHPQHTGTMTERPAQRRWGAEGAPYYESAMAMRARENTIYFASVNYALPDQESATSIISPAGECLAHLPYGEEGVLVHDIDLDAATGRLAHRWAPERCVDSTPSAEPLAAIACALDRLDVDSRRREGELLDWFRESVRDGEWAGTEYRFTFASDADSLARIGELLGYERLCCPFLRFRLEVDREASAVLSMSGPQGVREFIDATFRRL